MTDPTPQTPTRDEAVPTGWKLVPVEPTEAMMAIGRTCGTNSANTYAAMLASAPAPASGGVDAVLNLYREAVRVDVKMEGPQFMGANSSALKRAWEADRAYLSPAATPVSEAGGELYWNGIARLMQRAGAPGTEEELEAALRAALAKPAFSPAGGDVEAAAIERQACAYLQFEAPPWVSNDYSKGFWDAIAAYRQAINFRSSLSQSTSAGRVGE